MMSQSEARAVEASAAALPNLSGSRTAKSNLRTLLQPRTPGKGQALDISLRRVNSGPDERKDPNSATRLRSSSFDDVHKIKGLKSRQSSIAARTASFSASSIENVMPAATEEIDDTKDNLKLIKQ